MANVLITYRIMPDSVDTDLNNFQDEISQAITQFGGRVVKVETHDIAFGLRALHLTFQFDEKKGDTEELEKSLAQHHYIQSVEVIDVRRQFG